MPLKSRGSNVADTHFRGTTDLGVEIKSPVARHGFPSLVSVNTVGTSTSNVALLGTGDVGERTNFYFAGLFWQWYYDGVGSGLGYRTSADGINWSSITYVSPTNVATPRNWSVYFDGAYVHYAVVQTGTAYPVYYRRGIPQSDGTVAWSASEQTVISGGTYSSLCVCVDTYGFPVISYVLSATGYAYVTKSSMSDGTWVTKSGYPLQGHVTTVYKTLLLQLMNGKIMLIYEPSLSPNGGLNSEVLVNDALTNYQVVTKNFPNGSGTWSAVAVGDNVHLVSDTYKSGVYYVAYYKYIYSTSSWSSELTITTTPAIATTPRISSLGSGNLAIFYASNDNYLYCTRYLLGAWDAAPSRLVDETSEVLASYVQVSASENNNGGVTLLSWLGKSSSPYDIRFIKVVLS